ncbi:MAG: DUF2145 domain-containing protein [Pseudomonadota bacterium]
MAFAPKMPVRTLLIGLAVVAFGGAVALFVSPSSGPAKAGGALGESDACEPGDLTIEQIRMLAAHQSIALQQAIALRDELQSKGATAAIIARAANQRDRQFRITEDEVLEGMKYGHAGIMYKAPDTGRWAVRHLLFSGCQDPDNSFIKQEGLALFWSSDIVNYDILVKIPSPDFQAKLVAAVVDDARVAGVHNTRYNAISNPFDNRFQNSNEWVLSMIVTAHTGAESQDAVIAELTQADYVPLQAKMKAHELTAVGFGLGPAGVHVSDKPDAERKTGWIRFVSPESIVRYVVSIDPTAEPAYEFTLPGGPNLPSSELRAARAEEMVKQMRPAE